MYSKHWIGSSTRLLGVDDKTADNLAIGGALIGTVVGSGIAPKYGVMNDTPLGKNEVVVPNKVGVNNTNTNNGINSGKNVYVTLDANGKLFFDTNQSLRPESKRDPNVPTLISDKINTKLEKNPNKKLPNGNMATAHGEIGAIQQLANAGIAKNADIVLDVKGKDVCGYCRSDIVSMAEKTGVKSVLINANKDKNGAPVSYYWESGMKSLKEVKK